MIRRWREHAAAHAELREAVLFLEDQREGWGERFADAVEAAIGSGLESPRSWGFTGVGRACRRYVLEAWPGSDTTSSTSSSTTR